MEGEIESTLDLAQIIKKLRSGEPTAERKRVLRKLRRISGQFGLETAVTPEVYSELNAIAGGVIPLERKGWDRLFNEIVDRHGCGKSHCSKGLLSSDKSPIKEGKTRD